MQISLATEHFLPIFFSKNDREIEPVVLHTINPMNSTKCVTTFSWIFDFSLIDFSGKIFEIFFLKWGMPCGYMELYTRSKQKKKYFWLRYGFLPRMLGLEWAYCIKNVFGMCQGHVLEVSWTYCGCIAEVLKKFQGSNKEVSWNSWGTEKNGLRMCQWNVKTVLEEMSKIHQGSIIELSTYCWGNAKKV